ncbi:hypothetical protein [Halomonas alkalisoli]|uniref:hypothetical protein n=1 Tax=Halomonas alkalisoli TaxID=2907158 RepID=UPI001F1D675F|nr:hypothetical protein [Halomonas alkalisoli]MCE9680874.1 hypothetical protein [Halomonas alkalisoli]
MNTRLIRLAEKLSQGPITREQADRIAPASNGPHYIGALRRRLDIELDCERVPYITVDGQSTWYGRYVPTQAERQKLREFVIEQQGGANDA